MFYNSSGEYNDCVSHGACSIPPNISSMNEVMITILRETAFYLVNIRKAGINNNEILNELLYFLAFLDCFKDFSESQIIDIFLREYSNLNAVKEIYKKYCFENNINCIELKNSLKLPSELNFSYIIKLGEKQYYNRLKKQTAEKKNLNEIIICTARNTSLNLVNLSEYNIFDVQAENLILNSLNFLNFNNQDIEKLKYYINELSQTSVSILEKLNSIITDTYGYLEKSSVSTSTIPNKAIMVSGSNLSDLDNVLKASENFEIDVYTNGNLLLAHAYPHFKNFKNLKGHFGTDTLSNILDFATFPGAILLTKHESQNIEYLYRGRLFSTEKIPPNGVSKITNNDFTPLIDSAIQAKGFAKGQIKDNKNVGFNYNEIDDILNKFISLNSDLIFITGFVDNSVNAYNYLKTFLSNLPENFSAISFSHNLDKTNILYFDICNNFSISYFILKKLFSKISISSKKVYFIFTKCDANTLTNMIYLKNKGAENICLVECSSILINPAVFKVFNNLYNIKTLSNPISDIKEIIKKGTL